MDRHILIRIYYNGGADGEGMTGIESEARDGSSPILAALESQTLQ